MPHQGTESTTVINLGGYGGPGGPGHGNGGIGGSGGMGEGGKMNIGPVQNLTYMNQGQGLKELLEKWNLWYRKECAKFNSD
ncbi:hypothetical protein MSAN_01897100 [Mycena sanguinolenta]|uniref:Uncharacterized protein n=1 Tax=Mycena sanguinolenta TaxID=230812 RepID=A0A8H7CR65_9AGAR|nr:hypothetical protein MSAN_01897100 [Mycena sanguinolenta]